MRRGVWAVPPTTLLLVVTIAVLAVGCTGEPERRPVTEDPRRPTITIASFDFPESELLTELYGQALQRHGYPVEQVTRLGTREVVDPALLQGKVDLVPEYLGSALSFLQDRRYPATADPTLTHARLRQLLGMRGVSVLAFAPAEDRNGFVVTGELSRRRGVKRLTDLAPIAGQLSFGGPPAICFTAPKSVMAMANGAFNGSSESWSTDPRLTGAAIVASARFCRLAPQGAAPRPVSRWGKPSATGKSLMTLRATTGRSS